MNSSLFRSVDAYIDGLFVEDDPAVDAALAEMSAAGLPEIQVSAGQGKFLYLLAKMAGAARILEIGTLGGYSSIWLGRALAPGGRMVTLEYDPGHAAVAETNLRRAGLADRVEVRVGAALETLPGVAASDAPPFDLVFLDADKANYVPYLEWSLKLTRPGGLIVADNVIRKGGVLDPDPGDASAVGAAEFNRVLAAEPRLEAIILQQVGEKGHDGLAIARVREDTA